MEKFKIREIDHPAVAAEEVEKRANWYCEVLGYELLFKDPRPIWLLMADDGSIPEILPVGNNPLPVRTNLTHGWSHVALKVNDIETALAHLNHHNIQWASVLSPANGGSLNFF